MRQHVLASAVFCACVMLAGCGADKSATPSQQMGDDSLPKPDAAAGSVTGMPNPGTPSALPPPVDNLTTDSEQPADADTDHATDDTSPADPSLPVAPPTMTVEGMPARPPADAMPVMPAHPPLPPESSEQSQSATQPAS